MSANPQSVWRARLGEWGQNLTRQARRLRARRVAKLLRSNREHLAAARNEIGSARHQLEGAFTRLSEHFLPLNDRVNHLVAQTNELVAVASGKRDGLTLFQEAVQLLHDPIEYVDFCINHHDRLLALFAATESKVQGMLSFQQEMEAMLAPLTYIEVLIKIESASLEHEHRDTFLTVVSEIERLHTLVNETFASNTTLLNDTHLTLARIRRRLQTDFRHHEAATAERRRHIDHAISTLDEQLTANGTRDIKVQRFSRELARHLNDIVVAVQSQDIVNQKCEHVASSLAEVERDPSDAGHLLEVQAQQLGRVCPEIETAGQQISAGIEAVRQRAVEIDTNAVALDEFTQMTASADGMVQQLLDAFTGVREIIGATVVLTREANEAARPTSNIASNLSTTLGELSINMRLIALNAQVRSLQISQGTGLEILAARTAAISSEISLVSDRVASELVQLREDTQEVVTLLDEFTRRGLAAQEQLGPTENDLEKRLHSLRDHALKVVSEIAETVSAVNHAAAATQESVATIPTALQHLDRAQREIIQEYEMIGHAEGSEASDRARARLIEHSKRYTMHAEHQTHDQCVVGETRAGPAGAPAVDLFIDTPDPDAGNFVTPSLPQDPDKKSSSPATKPDPVASLGGNIDLF